MGSKTTKRTEVQRDVLFQRLNGIWYAFSEVDDEVFYSPLPKGIDPRSNDTEIFEVIEEHMDRVALGSKEREVSA